MLFNSIAFFIFLPIVFALHWVLPQKHRWVLLLCASYYFYMSWNAKYVVLILFTTITSYVCASLLAKGIKYRKLCVALTLVMSLGVLFVFKYFSFFFETLNALFAQFAIPLHSVTLTLLLPVGISFYTFQTLSYVIDVYRGNVQAETHFGKYATFVSFFPQLVAGPIERSSNLLPQINKPRDFDCEKAVYGVKLMAWGFFQKVVIADTIATRVDSVYDALPEYQGFAMLLVVFLFSIQIYCDFAGYSNIAIGTAKLFGIDLMQNFKSPYFVTSVSEFWRKWHISLSTWFKDYLYIPLGGNRCKPWRNRFNLIVTFLVSGLWHGANYTFIIWGGLHGVAQIIENLFRKKKSKQEVPQKLGVIWLVQCGLMFCFLSVAWVFFRAQSLQDAFYVFTHCLVGITNPLTYIVQGLEQLFSLAELLSTIGSCLMLILFDYFNMKNDTISLVSTKPLLVRWGIYMGFSFAFFLFIPYVTTTEFIYFQF